MTNIVSSKKCMHSLKRNEASELGYISQVRKILKGLKKDGDIVSSDNRRTKRLDKSLAYQIFYHKKRFFDIVLRLTQIELLGGVEIGEYHGWQTIILLNKNCERNKLRRIIRNEIKERKYGLLLEEAFHKDMLNLIAYDEQVSRIIKSIRLSSNNEDMEKKIDFFIILANKKEIPIQIKSSLCGRENHKKKCSNVPSLVYSNFLPESLLKQKVLQICKSYPNFAENL